MELQVSDIDGCSSLLNFSASKRGGAKGGGRPGCSIARERRRVPRRRREGPPPVSRPAPPLPPCTIRRLGARLCTPARRLSSSQTCRGRRSPPQAAPTEADVPRVKRQVPGVTLHTVLGWLPPGSEVDFLKRRASARRLPLPAARRPPPAARPPPRHVSPPSALVIAPPLHPRPGHRVRVPRTRADAGLPRRGAAAISKAWTCSRSSRPATRRALPLLARPSPPLTRPLRRCSLPATYAALSRCLPPLPLGGPAAARADGGGARPPL